MTRILILLVASSALTLLPGDSVDAGCKSVIVQKQAVVAYQPVYNSPYLYSVGTGLQLRAAIEVAKEELRAEMRAMQLNSPGNSESSPERLPLTASGDPYSLVNKYCVGCHSTNAKASEAFDISSLASLTCDERIVAINAVLDGRMPKGTKIPQELIGDLLGQLSQADTAPNASARVAAPKREEIKAPEPVPTASSSPWKFAEGDWFIASAELAKGKVLERWRVQHLGTGKITNMYRCEFVNGHVSVLKEEEMSPYSEPEELPPPEPNQESEVILE